MLSTSPPPLKKQYLVGNVIDDELPMLDLDCYYYVVVYVKSEEVCKEDYKLDMHHSIDGRCKVFCSCHNEGVQNLLILTSWRIDDWRNCLMNDCRGVEKYACTKRDNHICKGCFDKLSKMEGRHYMSSVDARDTEEEGGSKGMGFHIGVTDTTNKGCDKDITNYYDGSLIGSKDRAFRF